MTDSIIPTRFLVRGGTAANLATVNEVPRARELVLETDTGLMKRGDGSTAYNSLTYLFARPMPFATAGGTADALTADFSPDAALADGLMIAVRAAAANTGAATLAVDGGTARAITKQGGTALSAGDIAAAGHELLLRYRASVPRWELLNPASSGGASAASSVSVADAGGYFTGTDVEAALQEIGADLAGMGGGGGSTITQGTYASRPGSPSSGDVHYCTDAPCVLVYSGSAWSTFVNTGYGMMQVTPPVLGDFTQINFGTSSTGSLGPFTTIIPQTAAAYALRGLFKTAPATPYTIEAGLWVPSTFHFNDLLLGAGFRQSSDGKLHLLWNDTTSTIFRSLKLNSATSANSTYQDRSTTGPLQFFHVRFRDDGTNRYVDVPNPCAASWITFHQVGRTDFLTANQVGVAVNLESATLCDRVIWAHWKES